MKSTLLELPHEWEGNAMAFMTQQYFFWVGLNFGNIVWVFWIILKPPSGNLRGLLLGEIGGSRWFVCTHSRCTPLKGGNILLGAFLIIVMPISRSYIDLDQLINEATSQFTQLEASELSFFLFFILSFLGIFMWQDDRWDGKGATV